MSVKYVPVQWNGFKWGYDAVVLIAVGLFVWVFLQVEADALGHERAVSGAIRNARAFGACAFVLMTVILCIGPLARLYPRFLPLLYNRRHFGVITAAVATTHAYFVLGWYFAFSPVDRFETVLFANTSFTSGVAGFPFEAFGIFALLSLLVLAATSHDFWMKFLTPPVWKALHYLIYPAYAAVVAHVAWGSLLDRDSSAFAWIVYAGAAAVVGLHLVAGFQKRAPATDALAGLVAVGDASTIAEGRARIIKLPSGDRVAVFRHDGALYAIANACAHQNGPLGEGRVEACLVTCPWHGFQYDLRNGQSPAPFTEKVPTYNLTRKDGVVLVDPEPNAPGTPTTPLPLET